MIGWYVLLGLVALVGLGWLGLQVQPAAFPSYSAAAAPIATVPLPAGLPTPVERYYRQIYGEQIPVITSAIITGRAKIGPVPGLPKFPARFRFIHQAGQNYRHYIETTWFGFPVMRVHETYVEGKSLQELPWARVDNDPTANQGANLGMWSESMWFPAVFLTDPRVKWAPVDDQTAILQVPFEDGSERYVVRFDPDTGLLRWLESMRYKGVTGKKVLWLNESLEYKPLGGYLVPTVGAATWMDDGKPWAVFTVEEIVYNTDVSQYVRAKGL
jgi:hypothetical protein